MIRVENLSKTFQGNNIDTPVLHNLSFNVKGGEFVAIMGPSGCGKSTLLSILGFLDRHTGGNYLFDGKAAENYSSDEVSLIRNKRMGFVFQSFNLLPRTSALENVKLPLLYSKTPKAKRNNMAKEALGAVGLEDRLHFEPSQLSGGQKQRVAIARALINDPAIIFADEPTGNLDTKTGNTVLDIFQRIHEKQGKTIILITHEGYVAEHAQRIIHLKDGMLVSDEVVKNRRVANHKIS